MNWIATARRRFPLAEIVGDGPYAIACLGTVELTSDETRAKQVKAIDLRTLPTPSPHFFRVTADSIERD